MKIQITQQMRKDKKLVIKIFLFTLLSISLGNAQVDHDKYLLLDEIIELTKEKKEGTYKLRKTVLQTEVIKKYYNYKYNKKPFYTIIVDYDKTNDSVIYDDKLKQEKRDSTWTIKYSLLDSIFSKKDIEHILEQTKNTKQNLRYPKWIISKSNNRFNISTNKYGIHSISNPYYSLDGNLAIQLHSSLKTFTTLYVFKKQNNKWIYLDSIKNIWY